jgi:hypothetical protein
MGNTAKARHRRRRRARRRQEQINRTAAQLARQVLGRDPAWHEVTVEYDRGYYVVRVDGVIVREGNTLRAQARVPFSLHAEGPLLNFFAWPMPGRTEGILTTTSEPPGKAPLQRFEHG